jgi:imidazoleglycerol-phosphate dehydratase
MRMSRRRSRPSSSHLALVEDEDDDEDDFQETTPLNKRRMAETSRKTKETDVTVKLNLDGKGESRISTRIHFFDHMLTLFSRHGLFDLDIECHGDIEVDGHHTVEDVGIALGEAFHQALGSKEGITRCAVAYVPMDEALCRTVIDISGRPFLLCKARFPAEKVGEMSTELMEEFFRALAVHARVNLHVEVLYGKNSHHIAEAMFKSAARAFCAAATRDPRVVGIPSTKGVL